MDRLRVLVILLAAISFASSQAPSSIPISPTSTVYRTGPPTTSPPTTSPGYRTGPPTISPPLVCGPNFWQCAVTRDQCIPQGYVCDGDSDCKDLSDEELSMCRNYVCDVQHQFECAANRANITNPVCIPVAYVCDDENDCLDGADELPQNCRTPIPYVTTTTPNMCNPSTEFYCPAAGDVGCIPINLKCDRLYDCRNGEDERGCEYRNCTKDEFQCSSGQCVTMSMKCNGMPDCRDGSDEKAEHCSTKTTRTCQPEEFQCDNGNCVLWYEALCNNKDDCGDKSDETVCDSLRKDECQNKTVNKCSHGCKEKAFGYECTCPSGYKLDKDRKTCIDIDECMEMSGNCSQMCTNTLGSYNCTCSNGYRPAGTTGTKCIRIDNTEPYLLIANKFSIRMIDFEGKPVGRLSTEHTYTHLVDFDYRNQMIYYSDAPDLKQIIKRMNFDGSGKETIERSEVAGIEGLAVDWVAGNVYFTSNKIRGIYGMRNDGRYLRVMYKDNSKQPRAITLHPKSGYMFWTDWSLEPFIAKIGMDGSNMTKIVTVGIFWPNGITIDYNTDRLWWLDAHMDRIETTDLYGGNRRVVLTNVPHPYSIAVFEDFVFWSEWNLLQIERANRFHGTNRTVLATTLQLPYGLHVVHPLKQPNVTNPCGNNNGGCSHLCMLSPANGGKAPIGYSCLCPEYYTLDSNGKTCTANCSAGHYSCKSPDARCLATNRVCNGERDCSEGDDEENCPPRLCDFGYFQCGNTTQCVPHWRLCDKVSSCVNGADENPVMCSNMQCMTYEFRCASGQCIPRSWVCDGDTDCADDSDEQPKHEACTRCNQTDQFKCNNGKCIPQLWWCDWDDDCGDRSDEPSKTCFDWRKNNPCKEGWTSCGSNYRCVPTTNLCDGNDDCRNKADENPEKCPLCPKGDFQCTTGTPLCIPERWKCDFRNDCEDGSDENITLCADIYRDCDPTSEFKCANRKCVHREQRCDGIDNCMDGAAGSDERECGKPNCTSYQFKCNSGQCLSPGMECDHIIHCEDASDEIYCGTLLTGWECLANQFKCHNKACVPLEFVCDGENDCKDNSDEIREVCQTVNCTGPQQFRCNLTGKCISNIFRCDGHDDCGDKSDETKCTSTCDPDSEITCANHTCVPWSSVCDGVDDCRDSTIMGQPSTDEIGCYRGAACSKTSCHQVCVNITIAGSYYHKCECNTGFKHVLGAATECDDIDECASILTNTCPQNCTNGKGSFKCMCAEGFTDDGLYGRQCQAKEGRPILLYGAGGEIKRAVLKTGQVQDVVYQGRSIDAMDVDPVNKIVYWVDRSLNKIYRARIPDLYSDLGVAQELPISGLGVVEDIAYDWMGNNLYYIDSSNSIIGVANVSLPYAKTLQRIRTSNKLKSIAVHSGLGMICWTEYVGPDSSSGAIRRMSMSGNGLIQKVLTNGLINPASLVIDYYMDNRLFWLDNARGTIESAKWDGTDYRIIVSLSHSPISMDIIEGQIVYTTQSSGQIHSTDKFGRNKGGLTSELTSRVFISDMIFVGPQKYPIKNNVCANATCDGLCLPGSLGYQCACPDQWPITESGMCTRPSGAQELQIPALCHCMNGGTCRYSQAATCSCPPGFTGKACEIQTNTTITTSTATAKPTAVDLPVDQQSPGHDKQVIAAIVAPIIIGLIILGLVGLVIYWLRSKNSMSKLMSGHGEIRPGRPGSGNRVATPHDHITAEAAAYDQVAPVQRSISFEDGAVRFSNPIYDTPPPKDVAKGGVSSTTRGRSSTEQDINTNYVFSSINIRVLERTERPSIAEAVAGLSEIKLDLQTSVDGGNVA